MAKQRCPNCGAGHRQQEAKCRLCGRDLTGVVEDVRDSARPRRRKDSGGLGMIILLVILGVGIVVLIAAAMGVGDSDPVVSQVPFTPERPDGWEPIEDSEAGLRAELPGTAERSTVAYDGAADGEAVTWTATVADEVVITIAHGALGPSTASQRRLPVEVGEQWAATLEGRIREVNQTTFQDAPAAELDLADLDVEGQHGRGRVFAFVTGDRFVTVTVETVYIDTPQLSRVLGSIELDDPPGSGDTAGGG